MTYMIFTDAESREITISDEGGGYHAQIVYDDEDDVVRVQEYSEDDMVFDDVEVVELRYVDDDSDKIISDDSTADITLAILDVLNTNDVDEHTAKKYTEELANRIISKIKAHQ
jgi:hypothetical protein